MRRRRSLRAVPVPDVHHHRRQRWLQYRSHALAARRPRRLCVVGLCRAGACLSVRRRVGAGVVRRLGSAASRSLGRRRTDDGPRRLPDRRCAAHGRRARELHQPLLVRDDREHVSRQRVRRGCGSADDRPLCAPTPRERQPRLRGDRMRGPHPDLRRGLDRLRSAGELRSGRAARGGHRAARPAGDRPLGPTARRGAR